MDYFFYDDNPDIVVALKRESKRIPYRYDRVIWSKKEKRFIYGDPEEYVVYVGEEETPKLDTSIESQNQVKECYRVGLTQCESSFYDDGTRLYEVTDVSKEHKLIFDASTLKGEEPQTKSK